MVILGIKDGMVVKREAAGDIDGVVTVSNPSDASLYDLYQGPALPTPLDNSSFASNPQEVALRALDSKKSSIISQVHAATDDATLNALLKTLDENNNP